MKKYLVFYLFFLSIAYSWAQDPFIKSTDVKSGTPSRIYSTGNDGWAIFSYDSLKLSKFNNCGEFIWGKKYTNTQIIFGLNDFIRLNNGDFAMMNRIEKNGVDITLVTRLDPNGNVIWNNSYGDSDFNHYSYSLLEDNSGNIFIYGNVSHISTSPVYNVLIKLNAAGSVQWTKFYDHGGIWGGAITTSDGGLLLRTGDVLIKTNASGNVSWSVRINSLSYYYLAPVEVSDGYICSAYADGGGEMLFFKIDKLGNQIWPDAKRINMSGNPPALRNHPNGNIAAVFRAGLTTKIIELDKDFNLIKENTIDNSLGMHGTSLNFLPDQTPIIGGLSNSGNLFFARLDTDYKSGCDLSPPASVISPYLYTIIPEVTNLISANFSSFQETMPMDSFIVNVNAECSPAKFLELGIDTTVCEGSSVTLENKLPFTFKNYLWSTGDTLATISVNTPGNYILTVTDDCNEFILTDSILVTVINTFPVDLGSDDALCENDTLTIGDENCTTCIHSWNTGDTTATLFVDIPGTYILNFIFDNGCVTSDTLQISESKCECDLYLPNAFTPNSDLKNDYFRAYYYCDLAKFQLSIFNRWGQEIYSSKNVDAAWDGFYKSMEAKSDVYAYRVEYTPILKGKTSKSIVKSGTVVLLR